MRTLKTEQLGLVCGATKALSDKKRVGSTYLGTPYCIEYRELCFGVDLYGDTRDICNTMTAEGVARGYSQVDT